MSTTLTRITAADVRAGDRILAGSSVFHVKRASTLPSANIVVEVDILLASGRKIARFLTWNPRRPLLRETWSEVA